MTLVDADVLIELQRKSPRAIKWAETSRGLDLHVAGIAALELVIGSRNKVERDRARQFIDQLNVVWLNEDDHRAAFELADKYGLTTGLGLGDLLIAAQAINRGANLLAFNFRHFGMISGLNAGAPYARE